MTKAATITAKTRDPGMGRERPASHEDEANHNAMSDEERYLFDLQGYVILKDVVAPDIVATCVEVLKGLEERDAATYPPPVLPGKERTAETLYLSNILEADPVFHTLINIPDVIRIIRETTLGNFRLNHTYSIAREGQGFTYLHMHGTPMHPKATYTCRNSEIFSLLTKAVFPMTHHDPEDGCFAVIPGSHKSNFRRPWGNHPDDNPPLVPVPAQPGDAVIFTEALTHGSLVKTSDRCRRTVFYCYSVGYMPDWGGQLQLHFSKDLPDQLTEEQREIIRLK